MVKIEIPCKNACRNIPTIAKKTFLIVMLTSFMFFLCVNLVSSLEFDNIKSFDKDVGKYGKVTIKDWFGLLDLAELILVENTDKCLIFCSAEKEIIMYQEGSLIDEVRFETINPDGSRTIEPIEEYVFYIKRGNTWSVYELGTEVETGTYQVRLDGKKSLLKSVDWIIKSNGEWITDWAIWDTNQPEVYFSFDETSGDVLPNLVNSSNNGTLVGMDDSDWTGGKIDNALRFNLTAGQYVNVSNNEQLNPPYIAISFWINVSFWGGNDLVYKKGDVSADRQYWLYTIGAGTAEGTLTAHVEATGLITTDLNRNTWYHIVRTYNSTGHGLYVNGVLNASSSSTSGTIDINSTSLYFNHPTAGFSESNVTVDEFGIWKNLTFAEITELYNSGAGLAYSEPELKINVTLISPINNSNISVLGTSFIVNYTSTNANLTNATYYVWDSTGAVYNNSIIVYLNGTSNTTTESINSFALGYYNWNVWGCYENTSYSSCNFSASNNSFTVYEWREINQTFNQSISETDFGYFDIEIEYNNSAWTATSANLNYNGTNYDGIRSGAGNEMTFISRIDMPSISSSQNRTFFWNISLTNSSDVYYFRSKTNTHKVNTVTFVPCNETYQVIYLNFTSKEAENPYPVINATFKMSWIIDGTTSGSFENISEMQHNWSFCADPNETIYQIDAVVEYDGTGWAKNFYYLNNATITNASSEISLYLLNDSFATATVLEVVDRSRSAVADVYIQIQSYDIGTDTYYTTGTAKTADNGEDLVYLNWYDTLYKFILVQDGEVVLSTSPYKISETPQIFELLEDPGFVFNKFNDFIYTLYYNEITKNFVLTFTKPSGEVDSGCLRVIKRNITDDFLICETCETSASATVYCNVNGYGNGTFIGDFYATGSWADWIDRVMVFVGEVPSEIWRTIGNTNGTIMAIIFAGFVMSMFLISPVLGIIGMLLGVLGATALGFAPTNYLAFMSLATLGGVIIWLIKK